MTDTTVRDMFISALYAYASDGENNAPLSDLYDTISGDSVGFRARPVVGGHLALVRTSLGSGLFRVLGAVDADMDLDSWRSKRRRRTE